MRGMYTQDAFQNALAFLVSQTTIIEPQVVRLKYPELNYAEFVPIDQLGNEWARSVTFFSLDQVGQAQWFAAQATDVPLADVTREKHEVAIEMAAVGYRYNMEELAVAGMIPNFQLGPERAAAARRAYEEFCHNVVLYGDSRKNWAGLTNHPAPAVVNVTNTWRYQLSQSPPAIAAILNDINGVLTGVWQSSLGIEMCDTLLVPMSAMSLLASTQLTNTTMNVLNWILANNIYTQQTGNRLLIRAVRGLDTSGASGNGRIIAYRRDPEVLKLHRPMPHRFLEIWRTGPLVYDVPGIFRLGGLEIRRPPAVRYIDGVV